MFLFFFWRGGEERGPKVCSRGVEKGCGYVSVRRWPLSSLSSSIPSSSLTYPCRHKHARGALLERKLAEAKVAHDGHEAEARELFLLVAGAATVIVVVVAAAAAPSSAAAATAAATAATFPTRSTRDTATPGWCSKRGRREGPTKRAERKRTQRRSNRSSPQSRWKERRGRRTHRPRRLLLGRRASTRRPPLREAPGGCPAVQHGARIPIRFRAARRRKVCPTVEGEEEKKTCSLSREVTLAGVDLLHRRRQRPPQPRPTHTRGPPGPPGSVPVRVPDAGEDQLSAQDDGPLRVRVLRRPAAPSSPAPCPPFLAPEGDAADPEHGGEREGLVAGGRRERHAAFGGRCSLRADPALHRERGRETTVAGRRGRRRRRSRS